MTALVEHQERRIRRTPEYRSSKWTPEKLARTHLLYEALSAEITPDEFSILLKTLTMHTMCVP